MMDPTGPAPFPGLPATLDGSAMTAWVETHVSEVGVDYPITPSQIMGTLFQAQVAEGGTNLWGRPLDFVQLESEHSSASTSEGVALAGGRVTNFTSGQGLILMKEVLYVISGKRLPVVFHIGARALTHHALNVHCGHDDVMGVADVGWGILFARNVQEVGDLSLIARRVAEETETPFMVVQDGFLTTHTIETCRLPEPELMKQFVGDPREKLRNLMDPTRPIMTGVVQNQDAYMKGLIAQREFTDALPAALERAMEEYERLTGRPIRPIDTYRLDDAEYGIVCLGTLFETATVAVDWMREYLKIKVGALHVTSFRPFPGAEVARRLGRLKALTVIERCDLPMMESPPLACEIRSAFASAAGGRPGYMPLDRIPRVHTASAGLGSRDVRPSDFIAAVGNMTGEGRDHVVFGVEHPLTVKHAEVDTRPAGSFAMRGHSIGGYGSITTNKIIASMTGDIFGLHVQAFPKYGSEKKGLPTTYYLTVAKDHVRTHVELRDVDFVAVNDPNAFYNSDPLAGLVSGGALFIHSTQTEPEEIWNELPAKTRRVLHERRIRILASDTIRIARECAPTPALLQRFQGIALLGVFLKVAPFRKERGLSEEELFAAVRKVLEKQFGRKGEAVIDANVRAARCGFAEVIEVSAVPGEVIRG